MTTTRTFRTTIYRDGSMCFIPVPFDPRVVFGKVRAPVQVTLNGHTYRSTIASMGNGPCIPLRRSNREAARLDGGETLNVTLTLDTDAREVQPPADLVKALRASPPALERWQELSYSHQREHVDAIEEARKPETRARRIAAALAMLAAMPARAAAKRRAGPAVKRQARPTAKPAQGGEKPAARAAAKPTAAAKPATRPAAKRAAGPATRRR